MQISDLIIRFSGSQKDQEKAIFSSLFILTNRLQTLFDQHIPDISLKQFMLLSLIRQSEKELTLSQLGALLGCSRQNVKKIALVLEKKKFITIESNPKDPRALCIQPTEQVEDFFRNDFALYQKELSWLFEDYTEEEISQLFFLLSRLYEGIENLEIKTREQKESRQGRNQKNTGPKENEQ